MRKILNLIAVLILVTSCIGIGYILNIQKEVEQAVKPAEIPIKHSFDNKASVKVMSNIAYGGDKRQVLDIFLPAKSGTFPVMIFVHGGAWSSGDRDMYGSVGYFYAKNGYATVIVDHRLSPDVKHPAHIEDVAMAFAWVKSHISNYGGDPEKIYLSGHSSGAHLISLLVTNQRYLVKEGVRKSDIKGITAISGVYSIGTTVSIAGYGHVFPNSEDKYDASPINFIEKDIPPFLIIYAENDLMTLAGQSTSFHKALKAKGVPATIHCVKGENHSTILFDCVTPNRVSKIILDFMK